MCTSNTKSQFRWNRGKPLHSRKTAVNREKSLENNERNQHTPQGSDKASHVFLESLIFSVLSKMIRASSIYSLHYSKQPKLSVNTNSQKFINSKHHSVMKPMHAFNRSNYYSHRQFNTASISLRIS